MDPIDLSEILASGLITTARDPLSAGLLLRNEPGLLAWSAVERALNTPAGRARNAEKVRKSDLHVHIGLKESDIYSTDLVRYSRGVSKWGSSTMTLPLNEAGVRRPSVQTQQNDRLRNRADGRARERLEQGDAECARARGQFRAPSPNGQQSPEGPR
jgi:hypothetical protein